MRDERAKRANKLVVKYLYETHGSKCSGHRREGGCVLPGGSAHLLGELHLPRGEEMGGQKSAEGIASAGRSAPKART
jgi:hypothetical protein